MTLRPKPVVAASRISGRGQGARGCRWRVGRARFAPLPFPPPTLSPFLRPNLPDLPTLKSCSIQRSSRAEDREEAKRSRAGSEEA